MNFEHFFDGLTDPRSLDNQKYPFPYLVLIGVCAAMSGICSYTGIEDYAEVHKDFFDRYFDIPYVPRHDTFNELFSRLDKREFEEWFRSKSKALIDFIESEVPRESNVINHVCIDGKTIRNSGFLKSYHIVTAWFANYKLSLGQVKVSEKSNEIKAIPMLIKEIDFPKNTVVTIDALGCQREICAAILEKGADYLIAVKENQPTLFESTQAQIEEDCDNAETTHYTNNKGHGREEQRWCTAYTVDVNKFNYKDWPGIKSIYVIDTDVLKKRRGIEKRLLATKYLVSSKLLTAEEALTLSRAHWGIEVNLHWCLDVSMNEDGACIQSENAAINMNVLRKFSLNVLAQVKGKKSMISMFRNCTVPQNAIKILNKCFYP